MAGQNFRRLGLTPPICQPLGFRARGEAYDSESAWSGVEKARGTTFFASDQLTGLIQYEQYLKDNNRGSSPGGSTRLIGL